MLNKLAKLRRQLPMLSKAHQTLEELKMLQGTSLAAANADRRYSLLEDYEFKVFSQWGEDGIIQYLASQAKLPSRSFIEFGIEDFSESNCRFLLMKDYWDGFVIDGSPDNIERLRQSYYFWRYPLQAECAFITTDNVCELLDRSGFDATVGILSIDVDGNDWHLLERLEHWQAAIIIVEYNGIFGNDRAVTVPYDPAFVRNGKHHSNLYYGASIAAFQYLLEPRGYILSGTNKTRSNAFFVHESSMTDAIPRLDQAKLGAGPLFRESRDASGTMTFLSKAARRQEIGHLPLVDVTTGTTTTVSAL
ncbi:MAG: hypothetical protein DCF31_14135 [Alphaproteobacteria bacterium]|nr:MAG: hypothetical protein DCF31_14135 [Alphaproteobacteria bacterium]